jgi:membrane glycosyltransferase
VPVYNEDPAKSFSHVAAMVASVVRLGAQEKIHFAILSDTNKEDVAREEEYWFGRLRSETGPDVRLYYRRRQSNPGKKAGNIGDFIRTSGALYEYLIILDADSLVEGETMLEMARRMEAEPRLGLLQTLPKVIHARSLFGRAIQFSASFYSPVFARGLAELQGTEGPFWGHNAIVRTRAFAQSCGLPELPGRPPFGGHILSHDYVEAALLSRNDWTVRVDPDLGGSFEEGPDNVVDFAKRDRRWCQGNLQHSRVMVAPGLKPWSRFVFLQGIMAYVASPIWALFLITSILAPVVAGNPDYFPTPGEPVFPRIEEAQALALLTSVFGLLIGPKFLVFLRGLMSGDNRAFGGNVRAFAGSVIEIILSSVLAPLMLLYQSRSVMQVLLGADSGWPAADREAGAVTLAESWAASWWIVATGCLTLGAAYQFAPDLVFWVAFVAIPAILAPLLIHYTSVTAAGSALARAGLLCTPQEKLRPAVVAEQEEILARWRAEEKEAETTTSVPITGERHLAAAAGGR